MQSRFLKSALDRVDIGGGRIELQVLDESDGVKDVIGRDDVAVTRRLGGHLPTSFLS